MKVVHILNTTIFVFNICIGHSSWYGFGTINGFMTVLNNDWCSSTSLQMHKIGHNLGIMHSYEKGREYEDLSGVMGSSFNVTKVLSCS